METNKPWPKEFDGLRLAALPVKKGKNCQYCYYQFMYEFNDTQRVVNKEWNRTGLMSGNAWCATSTSMKFVRLNFMGCT